MMIKNFTKSLIPRFTHRWNFDRGDILPGAVRFQRFLFRRAALEYANRKVRCGHGYIEHFGVHMPRNNAGDTVLFDAIERLFDHAIGPFSWHLSQLRSTVDHSAVKRINESARAILVGGGGLFISDTNKNQLSGWQWNIGIDDINRIQVPLILFAVGYNQFRNSKEFPPIFTEHLISTIDKSVFVGLRNTGSLEKIRAITPSVLHSKIAYQPCMTTMLKYYYPSVIYQSAKRDNKNIAVNLAFDRRELRFGDQEERILGQIAVILRHAISLGYKLHAAVHAWDDDPMVEFFRREKIPATIRRLNLDSPSDIVEFYARMSLTIGMRGHAQMIPFGCGNAIYSIISHEKMKYFLEDIGHPEWGSDVADENFSYNAMQFIDDFDNNRIHIQNEIAVIQDRFWGITSKNLNFIQTAMSHDLSQIYEGA